MATRKTSTSKPSTKRSAKSPAKKTTKATKSRAKTPAKSQTKAPAKTAPAKTAPAKTGKPTKSRSKAPAKTAQAPSKARKATSKATTPSRTRPKSPTKPAATKSAVSKSAATAAELADSATLDHEQAMQAAAKARKPPLTKKFLKECQDALLADRDRYLNQVNSLEKEAEELTQDHEPGDVQFDEESGAGASFAVERDQDLLLATQARAEVAEIDAALARIKDGTYGICIASYKPISKERLKAIPHAAMRVEQKSRGVPWR